MASASTVTSPPILPSCSQTTSLLRGSANPRRNSNHGRKLCAAYFSLSPRSTFSLHCHSRSSEQPDVLHLPRQITLRSSLFSNSLLKLHLGRSPARNGLCSICSPAVKCSFGVGYRNTPTKTTSPRSEVLDGEKSGWKGRHLRGGCELPATFSSYKYHERTGKYASLVARASAASAAHPPAPVRNWWSAVWEKFVALCVSFAAQVQKIRIGPIDWLDIFTMLKFVIIATGALGAYIASKRAWTKIQEHAAGKEDGGEGGPMQVLARGATCVQSNMGPWSMSDLALGLTAMAKVTEKEPPPLPGQEVKDLSQDSNFLLRAQHWRALSEAVYARDSASFSLFSNLPESCIVASSWEPSQESLRPAFAVVVDAPFGAVVVAVRGTSHVIDMLLNSGASPEPFADGYAHGGFVHASNVLYDEVLPYIEKAFRDHGGSQNLKLVIVGHSMGAAVGTLIAIKLREKYQDLQSWSFCPPACMSKDLAKECKSFTTSFIAAHDLVPRFSFHTVENLRSRIQKFDWNEVERVAKDDEDWQNMKKTIETLRGVQESGDEAIQNLKSKADDAGIPSHSVGQKVKSLAEKVSNSEAVAHVKHAANQANNFIEGKNENDQDSENNDNSSKQASDPPPLHPPGRLLVLGCDPQGWGKLPEQRSDVASERNYGTYPTFDEAKNATWRMMEAEQEDLEEIVVSPWCISDHMLGNMCEAISFFQSQCPAAVQQ